MPEYDVLVTNPPFSGTHKEKCLKQCVAMKRGWLVLLPSYCATKSYMGQALFGVGASGGKPRGKEGNERTADSHSRLESGVFYAVPSTRYEFQHPEGFCAYVPMWMFACIRKCIPSLRSHMPKTTHTKCAGQNT